ncbi:hypothetical protein Hdeb2414_s0006g00207901 [Helianthus debilis subsp. tardiflorus]
MVVSDSLDGLAPVVVMKPKAEPRDAADVPVLTLDDPIYLESSLEHLLKTRAGKRKQAEVESEAQPSKKVQQRKISRWGNLDAFIAKPPPENPTSPVHAEPSSAVKEELLPSPVRSPIIEQLKSTQAAGEDGAEKTAEAGNPAVEKPVEVEVDKEEVVNLETAEVESTHPKSPEVVARDLGKGKFAFEDLVITITSAPVNAEKNPAGDQGVPSHDEENDPLRPDETLGVHYCRTYMEKKASEIHTPVWNLRKGHLPSCRN